MNYLIIDIGNTNIVFAIFDGKKIVQRWRISSYLNRTRDEYILWLKYIVGKDYQFEDIIIGSVVPDITEELKLAINILFDASRSKLRFINENLFYICFPE